MSKSRVVIHIALGIILCVFLPSFLSAQNPPEAGAPAHLLVTVEARKGSSIPDVSRADVMVLEGHDRDQVVDWVPAQGDNSSLELFVLLDDGSSFSLGKELDELRRFIDSQTAVCEGRPGLHAERLGESAAELNR